MRKIDSTKLYFAIFGLIFGQATSEVISKYLPDVTILGIAIPTGILTFVAFGILTLVAIGVRKAYRKFVAKLAADVRNHLNM